MKDRFFRDDNFESDDEDEEGKETYDEAVVRIYNIEKEQNAIDHIDIELELIQKQIDSLAKQRDSMDKYAFKGLYLNSQQ